MGHWLYLEMTSILLRQQKTQEELGLQLLSALRLQRLPHCETSWQGLLPV
jgi:hypothetical protein